MADLRVIGDALPARDQPPTVRVRLGEVFPLLAHAHRHGNTWLADWASEPILITPDLAEILARYQEMLADKSA